MVGNSAQSRWASPRATGIGLEENLGTDEGAGGGRQTSTSEDLASLIQQA